MKIMVNLSESFIDVWNEEKEMWERYAKVSLVPEEENKIPEKLTDINADFYVKDCYYEKLSKEEIALDLVSLKSWINSIIDYLKSKGDE